MYKEIISLMLELSAFKKELDKTSSRSEEKKYLLAVSGGADSTVLAHLFLASGITFHVAHVNYKLRGEDSDQDQKTVEDFCIKNHLKFHLYTISDIDKKPENSVQLWARTLRYRFFRDVQRNENLDFLVTAHHLNDQLETFIINLSKASGIAGLTGIPSNENRIIRPLLKFTKEEIYDFAGREKINFREDLSNTKNDYLRNKIRNEIAPKLEETNPHFLKNFNESLIFLRQAKDFIAEKTAETEQKISTVTVETIIFSKDLMMAESDFAKFEILRKYGFAKTQEIDKIFTSKTGSIFLSENYQLSVNRNELILSIREKDADLPETIIIVENFSDVQNQTVINLEDTDADFSYFEKDFRWDFDAEKLVFPIKIRKKKEGDMLNPVGLAGKKKVSKFFKDEKMSILAKQKIWLLADGNDDVLGILPYRQDRRSAKDESTKRTLTIFYEKYNEI